ncbi:MAG: glycosyltransferase family 2 protein [Candidatus Nanohaloarchaea archaeon]
MTDVAIVIVTWNSGEYIKDCLDSLFSNTSHKIDFEVVIVDNNSQDKTLQVLNNYERDIEIIKNGRNLGFSIANNQGLYSKEAENYVILNPDTEAKEGWLKELLKESKKDDVGIVGGKLLYSDGEIQHAGARVGKKGPEHIKQNWTNEPREVEYVTGACALISREVIEEIGYLDEMFSPAYFEETDLCFRARYSGFRIIYNPDCNVIHYEGKSTDNKPSSFVYFINRKNHLKFTALNLSGKDLFYNLVWDAKHLVASIIGYKYNPISQLVEAYREFLMDFPNILAKRYNREEFVPSYYCEDVRDYGSRY